MDSLESGESDNPLNSTVSSDISSPSYHSSKVQ